VTNEGKVTSQWQFGFSVDLVPAQKEGSLEGRGEVKGEGGQGGGGRGQKKELYAE